MEVSASIIGLAAVSAHILQTLDLQPPPKFGIRIQAAVEEFSKVLPRVQALSYQLRYPTDISHLETDQLLRTLTACVMTLSELEREMDRLKAPGMPGAIARVRWNWAKSDLYYLHARISQHTMALNSLVYTMQSNTQYVQHLNHLLPKPSVENPVLKSASDTISLRTMRTFGSSIRSTFSITSTLPNFEDEVMNSRPYRRVQWRHSFDSISIASERIGLSRWSMYSYDSNTSVFNLILPFDRSPLYGRPDGSCREEGFQMRTLPTKPNECSLPGIYSPTEYPLHQAIKERANRDVHDLLNRGYDVNKRDSNYVSPLELAIRLRFEDIVLTLLTNGAYANTKDCFGRSVLHTAVDIGDIIITRCLLNAGANVYDVDADGDTPMYIAVKKGEGDMFDLLANWGRGISLRNSTEEDQAILVQHPRDSVGT